MNLPNIIKKADPKYIELDNKNRSDLSFIKENVPKVVFKDQLLETNIGQWLEVLASKEQKYIAEGIIALAPISARTLMDEGIYKDKQDAIAYTFGFLLKQLGISETETCVLDDYDEKTFSCNCYFKGERETAKFSFRWGDMMDYLPEWNIEYHNAKRCYEYYAARDGKKPVLSLSNFTVVNPKNSNSVYSYLSPFSANYKVSNGDDSLSIMVSRPKDISYESGSGYVFRLKNDSELVKYLLKLDFPVAIDEVYKKMCEVSIDCIDEYPSFQLLIEKGMDDNKKNITDFIKIENGNLCIFTMTKNGKKVSITSEGNTCYQDSKFAINEQKEGNLEYRLNIPSMDELASLGTIEENVTKARNEISDVRSLIKEISGKDI